MTAAPYQARLRTATASPLRRMNFGHTARGLERHQVELRSSHKALTEGTTVFRGQVADPRTRKHVLVPGINNQKVGGRILKGPWAGCPVFMLTLEERKTCPNTCELWAACYGNGMPYSIRIKHGPVFEEVLWAELATKEHRYERKGGFVVRLHVLGDFYSCDYVALWEDALCSYPGLKVFGYTHHSHASEIGSALLRLNFRYPHRFVIRFSVPPQEANQWPFQATTIWRLPEGPRVEEGIICPASVSKSETCGTCGLCWNPEMRDTTIVFPGHGNAHQLATKSQSTP